MTLSDEDVPTTIKITTYGRYLSSILAAAVAKCLEICVKILKIERSIEIVKIEFPKRSSGTGIRS